ncbi:phage tail protein [Clostridium sp. D2Q-14]|uniref:phage tail spike protein n=1 Tax=Anaeromonas gelatinilytica TaxID=2683194 RepID=UPI00193B7C55|nr:phage tail spike protein [Anaeromonas gelatinilytica]MBS4535839.1 phage tail protein [Anaeromonas gelatinilytica]
MLHVIDKQSDTIVDFYSNHKKLFWDDVHFSSLNNYEEYFNFKVLYDNSEHLTSRNRVIIPDDDGYYREFIIDETLKDKKVKRVYAKASFIDDLKKEKTIESKTYDGVTVNTFLDGVLDGTGWKRGKTDYLGIKTIPVENTSYPFSVLKRGATVFEGELDFRIETEGNKIIGRYVDLVERIGAWNGKEITVGKDLIGVTRRENSENIVTALICYGPEREDGTKLEVTVTDEDARNRWGRPANNPKHLWGIYEPTSEDQDMTENRLQTLGKTELNKRINAVVEYECDQVAIEHVFGFSHEKVRKGDTVRIKDTSYSPPLYLEARVRDVERSITKPSQKKYVLGDFIEYDEEDLMTLFRSMQQVLSQKINATQALKQLHEYTYEKVTVDNKDNQVRSDVESYANTVSSTARDEAITYTNNTVEPIQTSVTGLENDVDTLQINLDDVDTRLITAESNITQAQDEIRLKVDANYVQGEIDTVNQEINGVYTGLSSKINVLSDQIELKADATVVSDIEARVSSAEIEINGLNSEINLKVDQDGVIGAINLSPEAILLDADRIEFTGHIFGEGATFKGSIEVANTTINNDGILVEEGSFRLKDKITQTESLIHGATNMVNDHSFELVPLGDGSWAPAIRRVDINRMGNSFLWDVAGNRAYARVQSTYQTDDFQRAKFGYQAAILEKRYYWIQYVPLDIDRMYYGPYTISAYFSAYEDTNEITTCRLLVHAYDWDLNLVQSSSVGGFSIDVDPSEPYRWKRTSATFTNLPAGTIYLRIRIENLSNNGSRTLADGIQMVPYEYPVVYQSEDSLWKYARGLLTY